MATYKAINTKVIKNLLPKSEMGKPRIYNDKRKTVRRLKVEYQYLIGTPETARRKAVSTAKSLRKSLAGSKVSIKSHASPSYQDEAWKPSIVITQKLLK